MAFSILNYLNSKSTNSDLPESIQVETFVPTPTDDDYSIGYIERYFVQKTNDTNSFIFEISSQYKDVIFSNPLYTVTTIQWRLIGQPQEIMNSNKKSIEFVNDRLPKLAAYLPNLLQFAKIN